METAFWLLVVVLSIRWLHLYSGTPLRYRHNPCAGRLWRQAFPDQDKESIRNFLSCVTDAMAFPSKDGLRFRPTDRVVDVYRAIYGGRTPLGDCMECETLLDNLVANFGTDMDTLAQAWSEELTLGELYESVAP